MIITQKQALAIAKLDQTLIVEPTNLHGDVMCLRNGHTVFMVDSSGGCTKMEDSSTGMQISRVN